MAEDIDGAPITMRDIVITYEELGKAPLRNPVTIISRATLDRMLAADCTDELRASIAEALESGELIVSDFAPDADTVYKVDREIAEKVINS